MDFKRGSWLWLILGLTAFYFSVRLIGIDQVVTTDEPFWLGRSANFYRALRTGDLVHTYQMAHPGILTMWAGAMSFLVRAPEYSRLVPGNLEDVYSIETVLRQNGIDPLRLMVAAKISKLLLQSVFFAIAMGFLFAMVSRQIAALAGVLIVFDPFLSGLDSALHVDGLFTIVCFAALLAIVYASVKSPLVGEIRTGSGWWVVAGVLAACAWLSRATGIVLVGVAGLALCLAVLDASWSRWTNLSQTVTGAIVRFLIWALTGLVTTVVLLPALWVEPEGTLQKIWKWSFSAATEGHENPTFFRGEIHTGNPGWSFYPVVLAWRSTPIEWLGLAAFFVTLPLLWRARLLSKVSIRLIVVAVVFVFVYVVAMSGGAKKFDRYVLPVFPVIALLASIGFANTAALVRLRKPGFGRIAPSAAVVLVTIQVAATVSALPYRLDYYSPLLGGPVEAQHALQMGWGQGGKQVVDYLESQLSEGQVVVMQTSAVPSAFSYFLPNDPDIHIKNFGMDTPAGWYETDYYVAGIQQTQRDLAPSYRVLRHYMSDHVVGIGGVPYFTIYSPRTLPLPEELRDETACNAVFGSEIQLMQIIGRDSAVDFYWLTLDADVKEVTIDVRFHAPNGDALESSVDWQLASDGLISRARVPLPDGFNGDLANYVLSLTVHSKGQDGSLAVVVPWSTGESRDFETQSECYYTFPPVEGGEQ